MPGSADILLVGSGPIGASAAYFLTHAPAAGRIALLTEEPTDGPTPTYRSAGGSVRWHWDNPQMQALTRATADFLHHCLADGVDLHALEDEYVLLHRGGAVPSLNISSEKLVHYLLNQAKQRGLSVHEGVRVKTVTGPGQGIAVETSDGIWRSPLAVLAVGAALPAILPDNPVKFKKRQLLVLDTPVRNERRDWPHTVAPLDGGLVYLFVKRFANGLRLCLGQEDLLEFSNEAVATDFLPALRERGLETLFPFLEGAGVERILWGFDAVNKLPHYWEPRPGLLVVSCGSAVRSCIGIGQEIARRLTA